MQNNCGDFIAYHVYCPNTTKYFNIDFENKKIAQIYCNFVSIRDNKEYKIKKILYCIGKPNYKDNEVMEAIDNAE